MYVVASFTQLQTALICKFYVRKTVYDFLKGFKIIRDLSLNLSINSVLVWMMICLVDHRLFGGLKY